jgi:hypothetical protein
VGAYNTVTFDWKDTATNEVRSLRAQFKYGDTWQDEYRVGDVLRWGGNDIGDRFARRVVVDAVVDAPASSESVPTEFEIHIVNGTIDKVVPASGKFDFVAAQNNFIVLER